MFNSEEEISLIEKFSVALDLLNKYDNQSLPITGTADNHIFLMTYDYAKQGIKVLNAIYGNQFFGKEKDDSFKSVLAGIYQTADDGDLYDTIEEKAANLLYFIVKNHPFFDGNKRIGSYLFVWFMNQNKVLFDSEGICRISNQTLRAITLMIAMSSPNDKENIIALVVNMLSRPVK